MRELIQDTAFGFFIRTITRGKLLQWEDQYEPNALQKYLSTASTRATTARAQSSGGEEKQGDLEAASDTQQIKFERSTEQLRPREYELIDWLPNDPKNPRNWSMLKKVFVTFQICLLTTSVYIGSAIYTAGIEGIQEKFHVSQVAALLGLTLFVIGYGLGPMVWAPLSEMPFIGRNPVYVGTLVVFVGLQPTVIYAKNFGMLLAFRFLTGLFGSPVLATGGASVADLYSPTKRAYAMSVWGIAAVLGPVLGPLIGGFAAEAKGWQWPIWELLWLSGFCLVFVFFFLPETSANNILYRRTVRLRALRAGDSNAPVLKSEGELEAEGMTAREAAMMVLVRPFTLSFTEPILLSLNLYIALLYALLYLWFESFPIVFIGDYHFTEGTLGLAYVGILAGAFLTLPPFFYFLYRYLEPRFDSRGEIKPELRLPPAFVGGICIPICLFWFGWSAGRTHWIVPIIGTSLFSVGAFLLFNSVLNYLGDAYPKHAASVYAGNDLMRSAFGASFPLFARALFDRLGVDWGSTLLAFLSIAFIPIPLVLFRYGERIRLNSKHARHDL